MFLPRIHPHHFGCSRALPLREHPDFLLAAAAASLLVPRDSCALWRSLFRYNSCVSGHLRASRTGRRPRE